MRVLILEDDEGTAKALLERLQEEIEDVLCHLCECAAAARSAIGAMVFDAAIIDLRVPSEVGAGDASVDNGIAFETHLREVQPGALRVFYTASDLEMVKEELRIGRSEDFFACGDRFCLVDHVKKDGVSSLNACVAEIVLHSKRLASLDEVELAGEHDFDDDARRALALAVRHTEGHSGRVVAKTGKSLSATATVESLNRNGDVVAHAFCKAGPPAEIEREIEGHKRARLTLAPTSFPPLIQEIDVGVGVHRALLFAKAPSTMSFYDLVDDDREKAAGVVDQLVDVFEPWTQLAKLETNTVGGLLHPVLIQPDFPGEKYGPQIDQLSLGRIADIRLDGKSHCQHGDLHGSNLFVVDTKPFLIDFAHTRDQFGPVDQVSLEMSAIFHEASPSYGTAPELSWASFILDGSYDLVANACRRWATAAGHETMEYVAAMLAYALWILKHEDELASICFGIAGAAVDYLATG